jgi:hypothetical protein
MRLVQAHNTCMVAECRMVMTNWLCRYNDGDRDCIVHFCRRTSFTKASWKTKKEMVQTN